MSQVRRGADRRSGPRAWKTTSTCGRRLPALPPCRLVVPLRARSPSGTHRGGCGGCECGKLPLPTWGRLPAPPCRLAILSSRCGQGAHQEPAEGCVGATSTASCRSLLGAVALPCRPTACRSLEGKEPIRSLRRP
ncbi:hypothetical protein NDU88_005031 [Pleurodeles waltl]|uniref:Uncharacterized protein n=1 Tax=Pleurodeles waltl TaxID=8319 RepID=A0AAV7NLC7_PLEWA|nr:hypothetical protein NDU88_005031 [Pleurodeles waltl]